MAWEIDPDFALQSRITFGRAGMVACAAAAIAAGGAVLFGSSDAGLSGLLLTPAFVLLFIALPYSALQVIALDRDGRFDQRRLAGRPGLALGAAVLTGSSWLFWVTGAALLLAAVAAGGQVRILDVAVLVALGMAIALLLLVMPDDRAGTWLLRAAVLIVALILAALAQVDVRRSSRWALIRTQRCFSSPPPASRRWYRGDAADASTPRGIFDDAVQPCAAADRHARDAPAGARTGPAQRGRRRHGVGDPGGARGRGHPGRPRRRVASPDTQPTWREAMAIGSCTARCCSPLTTVRPRRSESSNSARSIASGWPASGRGASSSNGAPACRCPSWPSQPPSP